jgi:hypothetical protein
LALEALDLVLDAELLGARQELLAGDHVVHRPVADVVEGDDALTLHAGGEDVLVAQDADVRLLGQRRLQGERAALHEGDIRLEPVLLEQLLLLGDVERAE